MLQDTKKINTTHMGWQYSRKVNPLFVGFGLFTQQNQYILHCKTIANNHELTINHIAGHTVNQIHI